MKTLNIALVTFFTIGMAFITLILNDVYPWRYKQNTFHIKVGCLGIKTYGFDHPIIFTNNNWATQSKIMDTFDISDSTSGNEVVYQQFLFENSSQAILLAKKLSTYQLCIKYNDSVNNKYSELKYLRNLHPIKKVEVTESKEECCKVINIK